MEESQNLQVLRVLNSVCSEMNLIPVHRERYVPSNGKWIIEVQGKNSGDPWILEFFAGVHRGLRYKFLEGHYLHGFEYKRRIGDMHCFGYRRSTNVQHWIGKEISVRDKETAIVPIIKNILRVMCFLIRKGWAHQKLTLENVRMMDNRPPVIGDLELIVPAHEIRMKDLAPVTHLPPELLTLWSVIEHDVDKAQMWILGSQVLDVLIGKHASGKAFHQHDPAVKVSRRRALKNIRRNIRYLPYILAASHLSNEMQEFLLKVLALNPKMRMNALQAMAFFDMSNDD